VRLALRDGYGLQPGQPLHGGRLHSGRPVTEAEYEAAALPELASLVAALDEIDAPSFEAELAADILTLEFPDGTRYVLNSHRAARQIWMAAERSAWHFDFGPQTKRWVAAKSGDELWSTVSRMLTKKLGAPVTLDPSRSP
jgi:CyaY protein